MTVKPRESFRFKLTLWVTLVTVAVFTIVLIAVMYLAGNEVRTGVRNTVNGKLDYVIQNVNGYMQRTELAAANLHSTVSSPHMIHNPDSIYALFREFLETNPSIQGVNLAYAKGQMPGHADGCCPYVMHTATGFISQDLYLKKDYFNHEWYKVPYTTRRPYWTRPFRETNGTLICSYCMPVTDRHGNVTKVLILDVSLDRLTDNLQHIRPYPHSIITIIDDGGTFIAHPNHSYILNESVHTLMQKSSYEPNREILQSIKSGKRGNGNYRDNDGKVYVYHAPIGYAGWTAILEVPHRDVGRGMDHLVIVIIVLMLVGVIALGLVCHIVISRLANPLEQFALAARQISHGDFNISLPVVRQRNELYDLRSALTTMRTSLDRYIKRLTESTNRHAQIENELATARRIQMAMVPDAMAANALPHQIDICGRLIPARAVDGDLYDYLQVGDSLYFCIGDVSGKGIPASLVMAITRTLFRNLARKAPSTAEIANNLNSALVDGNDEMMFVTMLIGRIDISTHRLTLCNCGHNHPVVNAVIEDADTMQLAVDGQPRYLDNMPTNLPIGIQTDYQYTEVSMTVEPGTELILYTDGITEAENTSHDLFGEERLIKSVQHLPFMHTTSQSVGQIINDVNAYTIGAEQSDDITVLSVMINE